MVINTPTLRDEIELNLMEMFNEVRPFSPNEDTVSKYKDGGFGTSNLAFALYSNGHNKRGLSTQNPYGLIYEDGMTIFSLGYFKRELDPTNEKGFVTIVAPRGKDRIETIKTVDKFTNKILGSNLPCRGIYARFLTLDQYKQLLNQGFSPIEEAPWHDDAPKEDETYTNSILDIRATRKNMRLARNRFENFLRRNCLEYKVETLTPNHKDSAMSILHVHFKMLKAMGKQIGSTPEDHYNSLDSNFLNLKEVYGTIGFLGGIPASFFVGESLSSNRVGLYSGYTLRQIESVGQLGVSNPTGFSAIPLYAYSVLIDNLSDLGFEELHLGGSELPSLNKFKRGLGAQRDPTYWALKLKDTVE